MGGNLQDSLTSENGVDILKDGEGISYQGKSAEKEELAYNTLKVPRGGEFKVKLQDGTVVYVNSASQLQLSREIHGRGTTGVFVGRGLFRGREKRGNAFRGGDGRRQDQGAGYTV